MPKFPDKSELLTLEQALSAILTSIAMEEVALSHVITAESEKIRYVIEHAKTNGCDCTDMKSILAVNKSVADVIEKITALQVLLKEKLDIASRHITPKPVPPCISVFKTDPGYYWHKSQTLLLHDHAKCDNGVKLIRKNCETLILLPKGRAFEITFELEAVNNKPCPVIIDMEFRQGQTVVRREPISHKPLEHNIKISHKVSYVTPHDGLENTVAIKLVTPESLSSVSGRVMVKIIK